MEALYKELGEIGRESYPLDPAGLLRRKHLLACPTVIASAGRGASREQLARWASLTLHKVIRDLRDETDRLIAEAIFAAAPPYENKQVGERQALLAEEHGIGIDVYNDSRRDVLIKVIYGLRSYSFAPAFSIFPMPASDVGATATTFYYATVATRIVLTERVRLLGDLAGQLAEPNLTLFDAHVRFLLKAQRYLHTISRHEDLVLPELTAIYDKIVASGPLRDMLYLALLYGGRDTLSYPPEMFDYHADLYLRGAWKTWYEYQELGNGGETGGELHTLSLSTLQFREKLPIVRHLDERDRLNADEITDAARTAHTVLERAAKYEPPRPSNAESQTATGLTGVLKTGASRIRWINTTMAQVSETVQRESQEVDRSKPWDHAIANRLHTDPEYGISDKYKVT